MGLTVPISRNLGLADLNAAMIAPFTCTAINNSFQCILLHECDYRRVLKKKTCHNVTVPQLIHP